MGVSIYCTGKRDEPLSDEEYAAVEELREMCLSSDEINDALEHPRGKFKGPNFIYQPREGLDQGVVLIGSAQLFGSKKSMKSALVRWMTLLSRIRQVIKGVDWHVHLDDLDLDWNEQEQQYFFPDNPPA